MQWAASLTNSADILRPLFSLRCDRVRLTGSLTELKTIGKDPYLLGWTMGRVLTRY